MKYLAIKIRGMSHWIWFEAKQSVEMSGVFKGSNGWGKNGAQTDVEVLSEDIVGRISSSELQY